MALTLENLDRRVTALEKAAETEKNIIRAVSEVLSQSETRINQRMIELRIEMKAEMLSLSDRMDGLSDRMTATERRFTDLLNERFDAVMAAIDRLHNPPR